MFRVEASIATDPAASENLMAVGLGGTATLVPPYEPSRNVHALRTLLLACRVPGVDWVLVRRQGRRNARRFESVLLSD